MLTTDEAPRVGVVALHPANGPSRDFPLLRHHATALPARGIAVLRLDRRAPSVEDGDLATSRCESKRQTRSLRSPSCAPQRLPSCRSSFGVLFRVMKGGRVVMSGP